MNHRVRLLVAALLLLSAADGVRAQRAAGPVVTRRVRPAAARDARVEAAVARELYAGGVVSGSPDRYLYNRVDLDGDGPAEVIAYVHGTSACGSAGCLLLVFRLGEGGGYELVSRIGGAENPVVVSGGSTNGWRDLIAPVRWGEVDGRTVRNYHAVLRFDGRTYPEQFAGGPPLERSARGVAYFSGRLTERSGFVVRQR